MRWSDPKPFSGGFFALYAAIAVLAGFELVALYNALTPDVGPNYRAYYLDRTSTCLVQPVTGEYVLGTQIDFTTDTPPSRENRPCGWQGPVGDGLHAVGTSSRLYFKPQTLPAGDLSLTLSLVAIDRENAPDQRVVVSANAVPIGVVRLAPGQSGEFEFAIPATAGAEAVDILLDYPDAIKAGPRSSETGRRSIKLLAVRLSAS